MKREILRIISVLVLVCGMTSCATIRMDKQTEYGEVIEAENIQAMELFAKTQAWFVKSIVNMSNPPKGAAPGYIQSADVSNRVIIGGYSIFIPPQDGFLHKIKRSVHQGYIIKTEIRIEIRDGKIRMNFTATEGQTTNQYQYPVGKRETIFPKAVNDKLLIQWNTVVQNFKSDLALVNW